MRGYTRGSAPGLVKHRWITAAGLLALSCQRSGDRAIAPNAPPTHAERPREGTVAAAPPSTMRIAPPPAAAPSAADGSPAGVVLVTVDGVRWQDVFGGADPVMLRSRSPLTNVPLGELTRPEGLMPRTWELIESRGVALGRGGVAEPGAGCGLVRPRNTLHISLPGYHEILTGHRTACLSNFCPRVDVPTVLDAAAAAGLAAASISSWEAIASAASRRNGPARPGGEPLLVSAGTEWPGRRPLRDRKLEAVVAEGERARPFPAAGGTYRPDRYTAAIALEYLRALRPRLLHVGLGDTDEHGHRGDYPSYIAALRDVDTFIGDLADALEALGLARTTILVTSDHGRAADFRDHGPSFPESGRSFVIAIGRAIPRPGETCARRDVWLTDLAPTAAALLGLPRDTSPGAIGAPIAEVVGP